MMAQVAEGLGVNAKVAAAAPLVAVVLVTVAVLSTSGDIREGAFPWLMASAAIALAWCALGLVALHGERRGATTIGGWWTALAFLGVAGFFVAVGVGALLGIDEEAAGPLALLPVISMAFGLVSMTPAIVVLALGATRRRVLPGWGIAALWLAAPLVPTLLIYAGLVDGDAERMGSSAILGLFALAWVVVGLSLHRPAASVQQVGL